MALQGGMLDQPVRRGTDVNNDPNYWRQLLTSPNRAVRDQAEMMMRMLETRSLREDQQAFQGQNLEEARAQRRDYNNARLEQRQSEQTDRLDMAEARRSAVAEANATRRAQQLQFMAADPNLSPEIRNAAKVAMVKDLGLDVNVDAAAAGGPKGEYGPNMKNQPIPNTKGKAFNIGGKDVPPMAGPGSTERTNVSPATSLESKAQLAPRGAFGGDPVNWMAYKRDIGGSDFSKIFGTDDPTMIKDSLARTGSMSPASEIPDLYPGKSTIPQGARVGYYDKDGNFVAPAYDQSGQKLPMPKGKGVTGLVGTAGLGLNYDTNSGNVVNPGAAGKVIAGEADQNTYKPPTAAFTGNQPATAQPTAPTQGQGFLSKALPALEFGMLPALGPYAPAAAAFLGRQGAQPRAAGTQQAAAAAPAPPSVAGGPQPNPTPAVTPAPPMINQAASAFMNAPIVTPTPAGTPPAVPMVNPQASNDRADLLRDAENTFYGGGTAPIPTPTPTPQPQRLAMTPEQAQNLAIAQAIARENMRRLSGVDFAFA